MGRSSKDKMTDICRDTNGNVTTVLLATGQRLLRAGLKEILSEDGSIMVLGEAQSEEEAAVLAQQEKPDVVILDVEERPAVAREATGQILKISPPPRVVVVDTQDRPRGFVLKLIAEGTSAYLDKGASPEDLFAAIHGPHAENTLFAATRAALGHAQEKEEKEEKAKGGLTKREREILLLLVRGRTNRQVAHVLNLSEATVKRHLANLYPKIGVASRTGAIRKALLEGWISVRDITDPSDDGAIREGRAEACRT
jgi:DNA-binding NarL/FixJ family response regulator